MRKDCLIVGLCLLGVIVVAGDDHWVWRRERSFRDIDRTASIRNSYDNKLRREPTTRRPLPGEPENDEIEDYADVVEPTTTRGSLTPNVGTRQYNPYGGGQQNAGQFGIGGIGGIGGVGNPGVLVGPGGPTGIIGRQPLYPNLYQPGYGGFNGGIGGGAGGYPGIYGGLPGAGAGAGYPGTGYVPGYPGAQLGTGQGLGQYPGGIQYPYQSYPGVGIGGGDFNGQQFNGQYPGYPGGQQFGAAGPQYTEGYGLAGVGLGQLGLGGPGNFGFDEKSPAAAEGKSAKSVDISVASKVSDKLSKKL
ncbi:uncharacterized PE-PGRS family protein PE_PGRS24 [Drosophila tropicalis]|uniref:uncharacterized PE-PGRS family protein PE_PGRS24 n=1 Tax=Drosophila tropicalis TaxID=46794 RepID=UPI0035ABEBB0